MALRLAVAMSHAPGLGGIPELATSPVQMTRASCAEILGKIEVAHHAHQSRRNPRCFVLPDRFDFLMDVGAGHGLEMTPCPVHPGQCSPRFSNGQVKTTNAVRLGDGLHLSPCMLSAGARVGIEDLPYLTLALTNHL